MAIKKEDLINDVISVNQALIPIFLENGLHCIGCHVSMYESIEQGAQAHGLNDQQIDELIVTLNKEAENTDTNKDK